MGLFSWFTGEDTKKRKKLEDKLARKKMVRYVRHKLHLPGSTSSSSPLSSDASLATTNRKLRHTVQKLADQARRGSKSRSKHGSKSRNTRAKARDKKARKHEKIADHHRSVAEKHRSKKKSRRSSSSSSSSSGSSSSTSISEDVDLLVNLDPADAATLERAIQILQNIRNKSTGPVPHAPSPAAMNSAVNAAVRASAGKDAPKTEHALEKAAHAAALLDKATKEAVAMFEEIKRLNKEEADLVQTMVQNGATADVVQRTIQQAKAETALLNEQSAAKTKEALELTKKAEKETAKLNEVLAKEQPPGMFRTAANAISSYVSKHNYICGGLAVAGAALVFAPVTTGAAVATTVGLGYEYGGTLLAARRFLPNAPTLEGVKNTAALVRDGYNTTRTATLAVGDAKRAAEAAAGMYYGPGYGGTRRR